jgi:hypothetical protein
MRLRRRPDTLSAPTGDADVASSDTARPLHDQSNPDTERSTGRPSAQGRFVVTLSLVAGAWAVATGAMTPAAAMFIATVLTKAPWWYQSK